MTVISNVSSKYYQSSVDIGPMANSRSFLRWVIKDSDGEGRNHLSGNANPKDFLTPIRFSAMDLTDRTVLVTGASSGLGRAMALTAAKNGATVVNADIRREPRRGGTPTEEHIEERGGRAAFIKCDVTDLDDVRVAVEAAEEFDGLDAIVNNAGRAESYAVMETSPENWATTIELNLTGVYHGCLAGVEAMLEGDDGAIVNVASVFGVVGAPNSFAYSATKGGVIALTRQLARDYAPDGIRANSVSPGFVDTQMLREDTHDGTMAYAERETPLGRIGDSKEVANAVAFLTSDAASFITGQNLVADGGFMLN